MNRLTPSERAGVYVALFFAVVAGAGVWTISRSYAAVFAALFLGTCSFAIGHTFGGVYERYRR